MTISPLSYSAIKAVINDCGKGHGCEVRSAGDFFTLMCRSPPSLHNARMLRGFADLNKPGQHGMHAAVVANVPGK